MRILILSPTLPFPADDGGKLRASSVALTLAARHEVAFGCFAGVTQDVSASRTVVDRFAHFKIVRQPSRRRSFGDWVSLSPSDVENLRSAEMAAWVIETLTRFSPDVLLVGDPALTPYVSRDTGRVRVLDYVCVATLQFARLARIAGMRQRALWALRRLKFAAYLRRNVGCYDLCIVNSEEDRAALLAAAAPACPRVEVLPNGLDLADYPLNMAAPQPNTLLFHGSVTYPPNRDAVGCLVETILPRVRMAVPEARLLITGRVPIPMTAPGGPGVTYTGYLPDVRPVIAQAWACPVPLRVGAGGARFKVLEALALGTPVVSTAIGAEGLAVTHERDILLAEEPAAFAASVLAVLRSPDLRRRLSEGGRRLVERQYNWSVLGARLMTLLDEILAAKATVASSMRGDNNGTARA